MLCTCHEQTPTCLRLLSCGRERVAVGGEVYGVVMSWMLLRLESRLAGLSRRLKYFCAWLATCAGVRVRTENREMLRQSPRPYLSSP